MHIYITYIIYIYIYISCDNFMRYENVIFTRRVKNLSLGHKPLSGISETQSEGIQRSYPWTFKPHKIIMRAWK